MLNHLTCLLVTIVMMVSNYYDSLLVYTLIIVGHHGNLQETESPLSLYPSMRHVSCCYSYIMNDGVIVSCIGYHGCMCEAIYLPSPAYLY